MGSIRSIPLIALSLILSGAVQDAAAQCTANAGPPSYTICGGGPQQFNGTGSGGTAPYTYLWSPAAGLSDPNIANPICTATATTNYTLTVTDATGAACTDMLTVTVNPTADAALSSSNAQFTVFNGVPTFYKCSANATSLFSFDFAGTASAGSQHTINWGDGTPSFTANGTTWTAQTHVYGQGINTLTYTITQPNGCNDTGTFSVFLGTNPAGALVNPGSTTGCGPLTLTFPIVGWESNTPGTLYNINFNDGTPPIQYSHPPPASITHIFTTGSCGTTSTDGVNTYQNSYSANLLVENPCGTSGSTILPIIVSLAAETDFTISPNDTACVNTTVTFGSTSTGNEVLGNSCDDTPALLWTISPAAGWSVSSGTAGNSNGFVGATYDPSSWSTGSQNLGVNVTVPGTYSITLVAGNSCGGDTLTRSVCIEEPPVPLFTIAPMSGCAPLTSTTVNTSTTANSCEVISEWSVTTSGGSCGAGPAWNFAGGTNAFSTAPQFQFTQAGNYTVRLELQNSCGTFQYTQVVNVNAPPQVNVAALSGICATECVDPSAVVEDCGAAITTYAWTFPGGMPASANTLVPPSICFASATNATIGLTVTNSCGSASDAVSLAVGSLPPIPVISSNSPICAGQTLSLSAAPVAGASFVWSGPNGFSSNMPAVTIPGVQPSNAGVYSVVAVINGCAGPAATVDVQVVLAPTLTVSPTSAAICNGQSASFTVSGAGNYQWYIGSTLVGSGPLFNTSPAITTTYTVTGDVGGCPGSATVPVTVFPITNVNAGPDQLFCDQAIGVTLNSFPTPGTWSGNNITSAGVFTPVPGQLGPVTVTYTHTDANGCVNSDDATITVQALTQIADAGNDTSFCQGSTPVTLPATPLGGTWTAGAGPGGQFVPDTPGNTVATYTFGTGTCLTSDDVLVTVQSAPSLTLPADFTVCVNAPTTPLGGAPAGGTWTGNGVIAGPFRFDPSVAMIGDNVLTYTYSDGSGCASSGTITATVNDLPSPDAGPDIQLCDQPIPYQLTGTPAGGTWSGTTMALPVGGLFTPSGVGTDVFTYTYLDAAGCIGSDQMIITVVAITEPALAGNDTAVCVGTGQLQLTGLPVGGTWSGPQVAANGLLDTDVPGTYLLTYSFGAATCLIQDQVEVVVNALPVVDAGGDIAVCLDGGAQLLTADPPGGTWSGSGVDAAGNFDPALAIPGGNPVTYTFVDPITGCANSDEAIATVYELPIAGMDHNPVACAEVPFLFSNTSVGASDFQWAFSDGDTVYTTDAFHAFADEGTYDIRLIASTPAGCADTIFSTVEVWSVPVVDFTLVADTGCAPFLVDPTNTSDGEGLNYTWDFAGLGNSIDPDPPAFAFPGDPVGAVDYTITLIASNSCGTALSEQVVTVIPQPTALFGPNLDMYCSFDEVPFANASIGLPDTFLWDLGDGTTSTSPGPIITNSYVTEEDPLPITVTLIASNLCGSDTATQEIIVLPNEVTAFFNTDPISGCSPVTVELTQFSSGDTSWYWDLGDGNFSLDHDLSHTYTVPGTYTIELFAFGCGFDSYTVEVEVFEAPDVGFSISPAQACVEVPFTFTNTGIGISGSAWDFGDGNTSTLTSPAHAYAESGTYDVTLTTTSALNGCTATLTQQVTVNNTPIAAFTADPMNGCIDLEVSFTDGSTGASFYQWDLGDGNTSALPSPFHTYTEAGTYTVRLVAESANGCTDTTSAQVIAHPLPTSIFTLDALSSCGPVAVVQTLNASQGAVGYAWNMGDGTTSELNQPSVTYSAPGTYEITLTTTNQYGCTAVSTERFTVHPTPEAAFTATPQPGCEGYPIAFENGSVNSDAYAWTFGDGGSSTADTPMHEYENAGTYPVQLIAFGSGGCSDTLDVAEAVVINPRPYADFDTDTLQSLSYALQFSNTSEGAVSYVWDFDDGEGSIAVHPLHIFPADGGGYTVCLVAVNEFGCPDTLCRFIQLPGDPNIFVPNAFTPNDDGRNDSFRPVLNGFVGWNYRFLIFDRWGQPAFDTRDRNDAWDGRKNGVEAPIDVYVWKVIVERDGDARSFTGHVTVVR